VTTPIEYYNKLKKEYDAVAPGFCVLKWHHLEMHLGSAQSHSCFHCPQQHLSLDEDLHNTAQKKQIRKEMLEGKKPDECNYCWKIEDAGGWSPRITLSPIYTLKDENIIASTAKLPPDADVYPKYLELSFSNTCQLKCSYCSTQNSSSLHEEIKRFGEYSLSHDENYSQYVSHGRERLYEDNKNPFVDKFWEWIREAILNLHTIRVTGGEPLLHKTTFELAKFIKNHPCRDQISFQVNSNLCVSESKIDRLIENMYKNSKVYASIDTWGKQAEWIRHGLDINLFEKNLLKILDAGFDVGIMTTFCFLSIPRFDSLIEKVLEWKSKYPGQVHFDTPFLTNPPMLSALIANQHMLDKLEDLCYIMKCNTDDNDNIKFNTGEYSKFERIVKWVKANRFTGNTLYQHRRDFARFVEEHDMRRRTNWLEAFPELQYFYEEYNG
jgi:organic radical activating enzyme